MVLLGLSSWLVCKHLVQTMVSCQISVMLLCYVWVVPRVLFWVVSNAAVVDVLVDGGVSPVLGCYSGVLALFSFKAGMVVLRRVTVICGPVLCFLLRLYLSLVSDDGVSYV